MRKSVATAVVVKPLSETAATEVMWLYYSDNKTLLVSDVGEYRDFILGKLVEGIPATQVFAQFTRPPEPVATLLGAPK